jgi:hypothetical protein
MRSAFKNSQKAARQPIRETEPRGFYSKKIGNHGCVAVRTLGTAQGEQPLVFPRNSRFSAGNIASLTFRVLPVGARIPVTPGVKKNPGKICKQLVAYLFVVC